MNQRMTIVKDCSRCLDFLWDCEVTPFLCETAGERQIEDLHLIPDWCPLAEAIWTSVSARCVDAKCF